jgi:hypothetical protein
MLTSSTEKEEHSDSSGTVHLLPQGAMQVVYNMRLDLLQEKGLQPWVI